MDRTEFYSHLDDLFDLADGSIAGDSILKELAGWSSLTFVGLIALIDEEYDIAVSPSVILAVETVDDLIDSISGSQSAEAA